jgi:hypothetical protein
MEQNTDKITDKRLKNLKPAWKEGDPSPNPNGRPKGSLSFSTLYRKAIENIAKSKGVTPEDFEVQLVQQAIAKGFNGDRSFYADTMDRVHGKATQVVDSEVSIKNYVITEGDSEDQPVDPSSEPKETH